jgi:hypothetical protein
MEERSKALCKNSREEGQNLWVESSQNQSSGCLMEQAWERCEGHNHEREVLLKVAE